jgi:hypothetical protein
MDDQNYTQDQINDRAQYLSQYWTGTHQEAESALAQLGFYRLPKPAFTCPELDPKALSEASIESFGEMHARFTAWHSYAENTLAYVKSYLLGVNRQFDQLEAQLKVMYAGVINPNTKKVFSIEDRKTLMENTPRYIELLREKTKYEQMKIMADSHVERLSKTAALISRHVELRKLSFEQTQVNSNLPGRGMYPR